MFEINKNDCILARDKILYNIMELLQASTKPIEPPKPIPLKSIGKCSVCGREWTNVGERMACAKKHKGGKK